MKKILFPTDYSEYAEQAFIYAVDLARRFQAELHIL
ncbi:MAG: universal stress protein, partial [Blastocatellia bacterium]|nr:universal stress protein [Blastocatellia bacterium]